MLAKPLYGKFIIDERIFYNPKNIKMDTPNNDTLAQQTNTDIIDHKQDDYNQQFEDTPIWIRGNEEIGYFATIGDNKICENYKTIDGIEYLLHNRNYNLLLNIIVTIFDQMKTMEIGNK